jgi:apolipoprotein N-acyltransferase
MPAPPSKTARNRVTLIAERLLLAGATAVALNLCQPPWNLHLLGWLAPAPLFLAIRRSTSAMGAFAACFSAGTLFWAGHVHWLLPLDGVNSLNWGLSMLVLGLFFGLLGPLAWLARRAPAGSDWAVYASAWVLIEYLRLHLGFASTPWGVLAYSQIGLLPTAQVASLAGIWGVSFVLAGVAAAVAIGSDSLVRGGLGRRGHLEMLAPLLLAALCLAWGSSRLSGAGQNETLRVAVVQANVYTRGVDPPEAQRSIFQDYRALSQEAARVEPELIAWPASAVPGRIPWDRLLVRTLGALASELGTPVLIGSTGQEKSKPGQRERPVANSAFLFAADGEIVDRYDKILLLPFNEYIPLRGVLRWPAWVTGDVIDARPGDRRTVFQLPGGSRFGVLICWENLFPDGFRQTAAQGLDFVVSMTNEAFTDDLGAHEQQLQMNAYRAIENGVSVVRTSTTGVSAVFDRRGRILTQVEDASGNTLDVTGWRAAEVPLDSARTTYTRYGDWLPLASLLGIAAVAARGRRFPSRRVARAS